MSLHVISCLKQILRSDCLPERARKANLSRSWLPAVSRQKMFCAFLDLNFVSVTKTHEQILAQWPISSHLDPKLGHYAGRFILALNKDFVISFYFITVLACWWRSKMEVSWTMPTLNLLCFFFVTICTVRGWLFSTAFSITWPVNAFNL